MSGWSGRRGDPYAGIPGRRLFVAVPLPDDAVRAVADVVDEVRAGPLPVGARDVRWVRLDGLHLTLRFLGPTPNARIPATAAAVTTVAAAGAPIDIELGDAGTFPVGGRPRALWIGLTKGTEGLDALADRLASALVEAGWAPDPRPFRPHLTLARSDGIAVAPLVAERLAAAMSERRIQATIDRLGLFESVTGGGPARYVPVTVATLGAMPENGDSVYH